MAKKDIPSINYFKDKTRIADLLNVYLYGGNKIISPQDVSELNPILTKSWWNDKELKTNVNITDVLFEVKIPVGKENDVKNAYNDIQKIPIIISIQNQSDISYVMPVRVINADANGYYLQWKDSGLSGGSASQGSGSLRDRRESLCGSAGYAPNRSGGHL